ncbi:MAG: hypothetical protein ACYCXF_08615 [Thermoleophilia bacterium]
MSKLYLSIVTILGILAVAVLSIFGGAGTAVGLTAYAPFNNAPISVSPTAPCIGGTITASGTGMTPDTAVVVNFGAQDLQGVVLGTTVSDADGNWSLTGTVPTTLNDLSGTPVAVFANTSTLLGYYVWADDASGVHDAQTSTLVRNCSAALPATGYDLPLVATVLIGSALLTFAGISVIAIRHRRV